MEQVIPRFPRGLVRMILDTRLKQRFARFMIEQHLNLLEAAKASEIDYHTLYNWLNGSGGRGQTRPKARLSEENLRNLARLMEVTFEQAAAEQNGTAEDARAQMRAAARKRWMAIPRNAKRFERRQKDAIRKVGERPKSPEHRKAISEGLGAYYEQGGKSRISENWDSKTPKAVALSMMNGLSRQLSRQHPELPEEKVHALAHALAVQRLLMPPYNVADEQAAQELLRRRVTRRRARAILQSVKEPNPELSEHKALERAIEWLSRPPYHVRDRLDAQIVLLAPRRLTGARGPKATQDMMLIHERHLSGWSWSELGGKNVRRRYLRWKQRLERTL